jgi:hypothetical protein
MSVIVMLAPNELPAYDLNPASRATHVIVCKSQETDTMLRAQLARRSALALLVVAFVAAPVTVTVATSPQDNAAKPEEKNYTPEEKMNRRYPQPVRVGFLIGLPVLDGRDSTFGYIREVARTAEGKIVLVVPYRAWFGWAPTDWGRKTVAVPIETVAILARQVAALDFSREQFAAAPAYTPQGATLPPDETIRIAVYRR